jgi:hypothetical protein
MMRKLAAALLVLFLAVAGLALAMRLQGDRQRRSADRGPVLVGSNSVQRVRDRSRAGRAEAFSYVATGSGRATDARVYVGAGNKALKVTVGLYSSASGRPRRLLAAGSLSSPRSGRWDDVPLSFAHVARGRTYWIALLGAGGTLHFRDAHGGTSYATPGSRSLPTMPSRYPVGGRWSSQRASVYVRHTAAPRRRFPTVPLPTFPSPTHGPCPVSTKNAPGGPDPWGGCWPGPGNTGVPAGTKLTAVPQQETSGPGWHWDSGSQGIYIDECGVTLSGLLVNGSVFQRQGNGTMSASTPCDAVTDSKIVGYVDTSGACLANRCGPLVMTHDEIDTADMETYQSNGYTIQVNRANVVYDNFYEDYVDNHGGNGPDHCDGNCVVENSWEHGLVVQYDYHMNAVGSNGTGPGDKLTAIHDYMSCGWDQAAILPPVKDSSNGAGCSSDLGMYPDSDTITLDAEYNYFAPAQNPANTSNPFRWFQPSYCLYPGQGSQKPYPTVGDYIANNVFARGPTGRCGVYGPVYGWDNGVAHPQGTDSGNVWGPGNHYDDGTPINES